MRGIVLTDDELKGLEKQFGPAVRIMGAWNSDGTFGYSWISMEVVEKASESIHDAGLTIALSRLNDATEPKAAFIALLESFGDSLIKRIVDAYRKRDLALTSATPVAASAPETASGRSAAAAA